MLRAGNSGADLPLDPQATTCESRPAASANADHRQAQCQQAQRGRLGNRSQARTAVNQVTAGNEVAAPVGKTGDMGGEQRLTLARRTGGQNGEVQVQTAGVR